MLTASASAPLVACIDDDGSAVTVLVTAFAALLKTGFAPTSRPLELHFYAAEEGGLLGSKAVARDYAEKGQAIHGLLHMCAALSIRYGAVTVLIFPLSLGEGFAGIKWRTLSRARLPRSGFLATSGRSTRT